MRHQQQARERDLLTIVTHSLAYYRLSVSFEKSSSAYLVTYFPARNRLSIRRHIDEGRMWEGERERDGDSHRVTPVGAVAVSIGWRRRVGNGSRDGIG